MKQPLLSILIPTTEIREHLFNKLFDRLNGLNTFGDDVEILYDLDQGYEKGGKTIGAKRNALWARANGTMCAFIDDDDDVCDNYIKHGIDAVNSGMDCASLKGLYYSMSVYDRPFLHSIKYTEWTQDNFFYYRCPNHLNFIRKDKVEGIFFEEKNFGEDGCWSMEIQKQGRLKTEFHIEEVLYHYYAGRTIGLDK